MANSRIPKPRFGANNAVTSDTITMSFTPDSFERNVWLRQEEEREQWLDMARQRLRWGAVTRVRKLCEHHFCDLTQPRCCSCIDNRPHRTTYLRYMDGRGMVAGAKRWSDYCPGCKLHYSLEDATREEQQTTSRQREPAEVRCVSCGELGHVIWECPLELGEDTPPTQPAVDLDTISDSSTTITDNTVDATTPTVMEQPPSSQPGSRTLPPFLSIFRRENPVTPSPTISPSPSRSHNDLPRLLSPPRPMPRLASHQARRERIRANFERSFGTMSEVANDPDYVSPIASLYGGAYARFQERERERERFARELQEREAQIERIFGPRSSSEVPDLPRHSPPSNRPSRPSENIRRQVETDTHAVLEQLRRQLAEDDRRLLDNSLASSNRVDTPSESPTPSSELGLPSIFGQWYRRAPGSQTESFRVRQHEPVTPPRPKTPEPLSKEDLMISNECKICFSQHCDTLLLPCAHLALCGVILL